MSQFLRIAIALVALTGCGTAGFMLIEGWGLLDSLYMAVITLTTVGYGETHPLSQGGRLFTIFYLVAGLGVFMHSVVSLGEVVVKAQLGQWLGRSKMVATLKKMQDHFIVCGFGRFGRSLCEQLASRGMPFVIVESDPDVAIVCGEKNWPLVIGDATDDATLAAARIDRARGIACTLPSDAANLYVVMSARLLHKDLQILSRATTDKDAEKLRRAGADRVISMYATGAAKMAQLMANPQVEDFFAVVTAPGKSMDLAEVAVDERAPYVGLSLARSGLRERGVMVVGIRRNNGDLLVPPSPNDKIGAGDVLIALGRVEAIQSLLKQASSPA
ncbi:MAG: potassium channel protein [Planctomycetes bacterium]|nr:potassium channel protein [Planctomycetota bacterium]